MKILDIDRQGLSAVSSRRNKWVFQHLVGHKWYNFQVFYTKEEALNYVSYINKNYSNDCVRRLVHIQTTTNQTTLASTENG